MHRDAAFSFLAGCDRMAIMNDPGPISRDHAIQKLTAYFDARADVAMAFLFGSQAENRAHTGSDWDIAVYFTPETELVEWEEQNREYPEENRVWGACMDILKTDNVDLVVLNRAPASIADVAIRGMPLAIKDHGLRLRFMLIVTREAEDYRRFVSEFYAISQRSASLTERDEEALRKTITFIEQQFELYPYFMRFSVHDYTDDLHKRNDVERWIENIVNASIEMAKIILGSRKRLIPDTYRDALRQAVWQLKLPEDVAERFERWAKLRNVLAHEYLDIKWKRIVNFIQESESSFRQFTDAAKRFLDDKTDKTEKLSL